MVLYFVEFVEFVHGVNRLANDAVRAPAAATEKDILQALWDINYPEAHTIIKFEVWEITHK